MKTTIFALLLTISTCLAKETTQKNIAKRGVYGEGLALERHNTEKEGSLGGEPNHQTITRRSGIPFPDPKPVIVYRNIPIAVPHPVPVPIDRPYAVRVPKPYPVHIDRPVAFPVDRPVPYLVRVPVRVPIHSPLPVPIPSPVVIPQHTPYPDRGHESGKSEHHGGFDGGHEFTGGHGNGLSEDYSHGGQDLKPSNDAWRALEGV